MAHGIEQYDRGIVYGVESTWHGLPQYECRPKAPITLSDAADIASYPMEKVQLFRKNVFGELEAVDGANAIVRTDYDTVLVPNVGERFTVESNVHMVNVISEHLMAVYPELIIESVGTLFGGATFFLNLKVGEFQIEGDRSRTVSNLMYCNPLGRGSYIACAHNTRIVCNNTERIAEAEGIANQSLKKFRHTSSAAGRINEHLIDMAELKLELKKHENKLSFLAGEEMSMEQVDAFLETLFPTKDASGKVKEGRSLTMMENQKISLLSIFEGRKHRETLANPFTKYGMYQAYTDWCDHEKTSRNSDHASVTFDGIFGDRASRKLKVLNELVRA